MELPGRTREVHVATNSQSPVCCLHICKSWPEPSLSSPGSSPGSDQMPSGPSHSCSYEGLMAGGWWVSGVRFVWENCYENLEKTRFPWRWTRPGWSYLALTRSWCWEGPVQSAASHCSHIPVTVNTPRRQYNGRNNMAGLAFQAFRGLTGPGRDGNITMSSSYHYPPPPHHTGHINSLCHDI